MGLLRLLWNILTLQPTGMANPNKIDIIATDRKTGKLLLVMTEHRAWDGEPMRKQFHAKASAYADYVLSEQFAKDRPNLTQKDVIVKLDCACAQGVTRRIIVTHMAHVNNVKRVTCFMVPPKLSRLGPP